MLNNKLKEIRTFCKRHSDPVIITKYARYFKDGFDGFGIDAKIYEQQRDKWIEAWKHEMSLDQYLKLGDALMRNGKFEEKSFAISFVESEREKYTPDAFEKIGQWFDLGISNWATTDVLCMKVLSSFFYERIVSLEALKAWTQADSEWKRRAVPVTLVELIKNGLKPEESLPVIEPLMLDDSAYVQKGLGTLLRGLWKKYPLEIESFLLRWKDRCGRLIIQYATEKMDKDLRKKFRKEKKKSVHI